MNNKARISIKLIFLLFAMCLFAFNSTQAEILTGKVIAASSGITDKITISEFNVDYANMNDRENPSYEAYFVVSHTSSDINKYLNSAGNASRYYYTKMRTNYGYSGTSDKLEYYSGLNMANKNSDGTWSHQTWIHIGNIGGGSKHYMMKGQLWGDKITIQVYIQLDSYPPNYSTSGMSGEYLAMEFSFTPPPCFDAVKLGSGDTSWERFDDWHFEQDETIREDRQYAIHNLFGIKILRNPTGGGYGGKDHILYTMDWDGGTNVNKDQVFYEAPCFDTYARNGKVFGSWKTYSPYHPNSYPGDAWWQGRTLGKDIYAYYTNSKNWYHYIAPVPPAAKIGGYTPSTVPTRAPGQVVGGFAVGYAQKPVIGSNQTWVHQGKILWWLPPIGIAVTAKGLNSAGSEVALNPDCENPRTYTTYEGYPITLRADANLRKMQVTSRVKNFFIDVAGERSTPTSGPGGTDFHYNYWYSSSYGWNSKQYTFGNKNSLSKTTDESKDGFVNFEYRYSDSDSNTDKEVYPLRVNVKHFNKYTINAGIGVESVGTRLVSEDFNAKYYVTNSKKISLYMPANSPTYYKYYWKFKNSGYSVDNKDGSKAVDKVNYFDKSTVNWAATRKGNITAELWVSYQYPKAAIDSSGKYKVIGGDWKEIKLDTVYLNVALQDTYKRQAIQKVTMEAKIGECIGGLEMDPPTVVVNTPGDKTSEGALATQRLLTTSNDSTIIITFNGIARVYYFTSYENKTTTTVDRFDGVKPGTLHYRWRVFGPNNIEVLGDNNKIKPEFENKIELISGDTSWNLLDTTSVYNAKNSRGETNDSTHFERITVYDKDPSGKHYITPLKIKFKAPYGNSTNEERYFKVFLEAKYEEHRFIAKKWDSSRGSSYIESFDEQDITQYLTWNGVNSDYFRFRGSYTAPKTNIVSGASLYKGSLGEMVSIKNGIPAKVCIDDNYRVTKGYTGDPLATTTVRVYVKSINPDALVDRIDLNYRRFDENSNSGYGSLVTDIAKYTSTAGGLSGRGVNESEYALYAPSVSIPNTLKTGTADFNITTMAAASSDASVIGYNNGSTNNMKLYSDKIASATSETGGKKYYHLSDSFSNKVCTTVSSSKYIPYSATAYVDDALYDVSTLKKVGDSELGKTKLNSSEVKLKIYDNDRPSVKVTLVNTQTGDSCIYYITGAINDSLKSSDKSLVENKCKVKVVTKYAKPKAGQVNGIVSGSEKEIVDSTNYKFTHNFVATANQRFLCSVAIAENVFAEKLGSITLKLNEDGTSVKYDENKIPLIKNDQAEYSDIGNYIAVLNNYLIYLKPEDERILEFSITDTTEKDDENRKINNTRKFKIPITVQPEAAANLRILERVNEK